MEHILQNIFCRTLHGTHFVEHISQNTLQNIFLTCTTPCQPMTLNVKDITFIPLVCINIRTTFKKK